MVYYRKIKSGKGFFMLLFIIRHGDPIYEPDSLTPRGELQAKALAKRFAVHGLDKIFASPMIRAQETARPTAEILNLPIQTEDWASEDLVWKEFTVKYAGDFVHWVFYRQNTEFRQNGDELLGNGNWRDAKSLQELDLEHCYERLQKASDQFLERLGYQRESCGIYKILRPNEERVALFCHQGVTLILVPYMLGIPPHLFWSSFDVNHTGVSVFEFKNNRNGITSPKCLSFSDNSHLLLEGLPYRFQNEIDL